MGTHCAVRVHLYHSLWHYKRRLRCKLKKELKKARLWLEVSTDSSLFVSTHAKAGLIPFSTCSADGYSILKEVCKPSRSLPCHRKAMLICCLQGCGLPHSWEKCVERVKSDEGMYNRLRGNFKSLGKMAEEYATMHASGGYRNAFNALDRVAKRVST